MNIKFVSNYIILDLECFLCLDKLIKAQEYKKNRLNKLFMRILMAIAA